MPDEIVALPPPDLLMPVEIEVLSGLVSSGWAVVQHHVRECRAAFELAERAVRERAVLRHGADQAWQYFADPDIAAFSQMLNRLPHPDDLAKAASSRGRR